MTKLVYLFTEETEVSSIFNAAASSSETNNEELHAPEHIKPKEFK